jgi:hypothetical protein
VHNCVGQALKVASTHAYAVLKYQTWFGGEVKKLEASIPSNYYILLLSAYSIVQAECMQPDTSGVWNHDSRSTWKTCEAIVDLAYLLFNHHSHRIEGLTGALLKMNDV